MWHAMAAKQMIASETALHLPLLEQIVSFVENRLAQVNSDGRESFITGKSNAYKRLLVLSVAGFPI
jgi:hypothetical protein